MPLLRERLPACAEKVEFWHVDDAPGVLNARIKAGKLPALALHENPLADWSAPKQGGSSYGFPRDIFKTLVEGAGEEMPLSDA